MVTMSAPLPDEPSRADIERLTTETVAYLADQAPTPAAPPPAVRSTRVRRLADEVYEAHELLALQADQAPLWVDTDRVRRRRKRAIEAATLHRLGQDPASRAWEAARWRRVLTAVAVAALALALGWSTAGVQAFAAQGAPAWTAGWLFAWCVEPFMSLALLVVIGARAYLATRGQPLDHPRLKQVEALLLALTLGMNAWRHLPFVAAPFDLSALVLHILGPIVAVSVVTILPIIWAGFADLDHHDTTPGASAPTGSPYSIPTGPQYRANTTGPAAVPGARMPVLVTRAQALIAAGDLPADPSATQLRTALKVGTDTARQVRDALTTPDATDPTEDAP